MSCMSGSERPCRLISLPAQQCTNSHLVRGVLQVVEAAARRALAAERAQQQALQAARQAHLQPAPDDSSPSTSGQCIELHMCKLVAIANSMECLA